MDYGVHITYGAQPWRIYQQDDSGAADIEIGGTWRRARVVVPSKLPIVIVDSAGEQQASAEMGAGTDGSGSAMPDTTDNKRGAGEQQAGAVADTPVTVLARVVYEDTGGAAMDWQTCEKGAGNDWSVVLRGVPAGGLYRIETCMEYDGEDGLSVTRGDMVHHIGVGDVFLIAGQSNAAGRGKGAVADPPEPGVHMLRPSGCWDMAVHPLTEGTGAVFMGGFENRNPGHSPWIRFAKTMRGRLGYPIGLVNAAYGGAPLSWWNPDEDGALLDNAAALLKYADTRVKAVLWYQGEAEAYEHSSENYVRRFTSFLSHLRDRLGSPDLPVITVQLNRYLTESDIEADRHWGMVREAQRVLPKTDKNLFVVPSFDLSLCDVIHNSPESDLIIGERCAAAAFYEIYGMRNVEYRGCEARRAVRLSQTRVLVEFDNVRHRLNLLETPAGLLPFEAEDAEGFQKPRAATLGRNTLELEFARPLGENAALHGAWRAGGAYCAPWDGSRMPMLAFYGMRIE